MKMKLKAFYLSALALAAFTAVGAAQEINAAVYSAPVSSQSVSQARLVPCGTPFGIKMLTDGVVVTDFGYVNGSVSQNSPAETAGVKNRRCYHRGKRQKRFHERGAYRRSSGRP